MITKAKTHTETIQKWENFHKNYSLDSKEILNTELGSGGTLIERYNDAALEIQRLLQECEDKNIGFRALGNRWSLSHLPHHHERMQDNYHMNIILEIAEREMHTNSSFNAKDLFFVECGNIIKELTNYFEDRGRSLKASGASNQQSIAGAISTGVHGSAFGFGAIHDSVVGLNLVIGPNEDDIVYLEKSSAPALNDEFAKKINARVIRDDAMFNAAVVGLGAFGFIHGIVIETKPIFLLKRFVRRMKAEDALKLATTLDFSDVKLVGEDLPQKYKQLTPYHFKLFINPYKTKKDQKKEDTYLAEFMYEEDYPANGVYEKPMKDVNFGLHPCLITAFSKIAANYNDKIPTLIKFLRGEIFPEEGLESTGTLGEIFWDAGYRAPAFAVSFGIDHKVCDKALELLIDVANDAGPVPGAYAMRFVKASDATLAFTKYPVTCVLEMDGIQWDKEVNQDMITLDNFLKAMMQKLVDAGIDFTMHWAKNAYWTYPNLSERMFGDRINTWKEQRYKLLSPKMAEVFSNKFMDDTKLSGPPSSPVVASNT